MWTYDQSVQDHVLQVEARIDSLYGSAYRAPAIYAITIPSLNNLVLYVGKTRDLTHRIASHSGNMTIPSAQEYNTQKYKSLREASTIFQLKVIPLQFCEVWELDRLESFYQKKYMPPLCTQINSGLGCGDHFKNTEYFQYSYHSILDYLKEAADGTIRQTA